MAYTDFIAAIDLGSSHMVGMVGTRGYSGALSIVAYEVENSATCIRRGCVYNVEETASKIKRLILKLENKLNGSRIGKIYVGVGGQSLRSINHSVSKVLGSEGEVTDDIIGFLAEECRSYRPDMLDVLEVVTPSYFLDSKPESSPVGIACSRIEARYRLIAGRPSLRRSVVNTIVDRVKLKVADVVVAPLALADVVLSDMEKEQGCILIDFGAGVTAVTVYKGGKLLGLSVIPFGGNLITRDIMTLNVTEPEAERLKRAYGSALPDKDGDQRMIEINVVDDQRSREIKLSDLDEIVEARVREIIENIYARITEMGVARESGCGVVIAGGGAALKNIREAIRSRFNMEVRYASVRKGVIESGEMIANNPEYAVAAGILMKGTENCALYVAPEPEVSKPDPVVPPVKEEIEKEEIIEEPARPSKSTKKPEKKGFDLFGNWKRKAEDFGKGLFDEDTN